MIFLNRFLLVGCFFLDPYQILGPTSSRLANPGEFIFTFQSTILEGAREELILCNPDCHLERELWVSKTIAMVNSQQVRGETYCLNYPVKNFAQEKACL